MKNKLIVAMISAALLLTYPLAGYAWSYSRGGHHYSPPPRTTYHHDRHSSSDAVPYLLGGLLVGGILGAVLSQPSYAAPAPAPAYSYPSPAYESEQPPGEWVSVPGRWIEGRWVPAHRVWMPVNP